MQINPNVFIKNICIQIRSRSRRKLARLCIVCNTPFNYADADTVLFKIDFLIGLEKIHLRAKLTFLRFFPFFWDKIKAYCTSFHFFKIKFRFFKCFVSKYVCQSRSEPRFYGWSRSRYFYHEPEPKTKIWSRSRSKMARLRNTVSKTW